MSVIRLLSCAALLLLAAACGSVVQGDDDVDGRADTLADGDGGREPGETADDDAGPDRSDTADVADTPLPGCGDGERQPGEECDDGNPDPDDGCDPDCRFSCHEDVECADDNPCTADDCRTNASGQACANEPDDGLTCDDGNRCTEDDRCDETGSCVPGDNTCDCSTAADCEPFEDDDLCNGRLTCVGGSCEPDPATVVTCDTSDDSDCRHNRCNPDTGVCGPVDEPSGAACNDENYCTASDACDGGGHCVGSGSPCTLPCQVCNSAARRCDVATGHCLIGESCRAGNTPNPDNPCQRCHPATSQTAWSPMPSGTSCADDLFCNGVETCDGAGGCVDRPDPCIVGGCIAGCAEDLDRCLGVGAGTVCRPSTGPCDPAETCGGALTCPADARRPDGAACDDGVPCSLYSVCRAGVCTAEEICNGGDDDCDGNVDEGMGCLDWASRVVCPPSTGTITEGCGAGQCRVCTCRLTADGSGGFEWASCTACSSSCPG